MAIRTLLRTRRYCRRGRLSLASGRKGVPLYRPPDGRQVQKEGVPAWSERAAAADHLAGDDVTEPVADAHAEAVGLLPPEAVMVQVRHEQPSSMLDMAGHRPPAGAAVVFPESVADLFVLVNAEHAAFG